MKNFIQSGNSITIQASQDLSSGQGLLIGDVFGVVANGARAGENAELYVVGIFELPKSVLEIKNCSKLFWDPTIAPLGAVTTDGKDKKVIGVSCESAQGNQPVVQVRLNSVFPLATG